MRLVADDIKGKTIAEARTLLSLMPKAATRPLLKLLESAIANAKENQKAAETGGLRIADARVDGGQVLKRSMPRARGSAYQILKRTSKVTLVLGAQEKSPTTNHQSPKKKTA